MLWCSAAVIWVGDQRELSRVWSRSDVSRLTLETRDIRQVTSHDT